MAHFQGLLGIVFIGLVAYAASENRARIPPWRWIGLALLVQVLTAVLIVRVPIIWQAINTASGAVSAIEQATRVGSSYVFIYLGGAQPPFVARDGADVAPIIAFQILPLVIVFSALSALLWHWHWHIIPLAVRVLSWALRKTLGISGAEG